MPTIPRARAIGGRSGGSSALGRIAVLIAGSIPRLRPRDGNIPFLGKREFEESPNSPDFWMNVGIAFALVVLGGIFAGLTLGLMGQDEIYLQVIEQSGEGAERIHAKKVLRLLKRGKHWVLVTLLLSNVITNETLPIVLDRSLGGGWPAVLSSTVLIVIFGEIIPQSACVRYGLSIGAYLSPFVLGLMYVMSPVAYPTALMLDWILGEDHGTVYKKAGLKTLVTLHKSLGPSPSDRLNQDEVTIISAVLDLKDKPVGSIMTPIKDVFTMSSDTVLDEATMDKILSAGYSRIPIHAPGEPTNFVGMLLVKILITYDPEDCKKVGEFPLATLPETREETSCLDIVNFFQEGKSHMVLVSEAPGENHGALGVLTLEDVIEELIGEEIIDESDVYIDVHKAIRRINPSPLARRSVSTHYRHTDTAIAVASLTAAAPGLEHHLENNNDVKRNSEDLLVHEDHLSSDHETGSVPPTMRRSSQQASLAGIPEDILPQLKFLGPANHAGNPRQTSSKTVKIKHSDGSTGTSTPMQQTAAVVGGNDNRNGTPMDGSLDRVAQIAVKTPTRTDSLSVGNKRVARSGSLVERVEHVGGVPKTVIETTSSSDDESSSGEGGSSDRGRRRKKTENTPLLG
ncbi:uncharacterized protein H6S33_000405 [Morchella sextelata]|uniref:uncharacterized protein n=1 Tax=Morchella sextelata TaxID=1174677 RepID=UPI001D03FF1E|nr:uncharacterized protein H6S33_000405 [Morchella sextelata]KAH0614769.1 hypothetical protein H6S33_000405 [Morchella sextelata]